MTTAMTSGCAAGSLANAPRSAVVSAPSRARPHARARLRQPGARVEAVGSRRGTGLARRDGDAVVHEPHARAARPRGWQPLAPGRSAATAFPPATTNSSVRWTSASANTRSARCSRRCSSSTITTTARLVATLAREALFDPANAESGARYRRGPLAQVAANLDAPLSKRDFLRGRFSGAAATIEGELTVRLECEGQRVRSVIVGRRGRSRRRARFAGQYPGRAAAMVPRLFSVCGARARRRRRRGARRRGRRKCPRCARTRADVRLETIQEYLWRILLDWPQTMGHAPATEPVAERVRLGRRGTRRARRRGSRRRLAQARRAPRLWRAAGRVARADGAEALDAWAASGRTLPAALLGELSLDAALGRCERPADAGSSARCARARGAADHGRRLRFETAPRWYGAPVETGALARMRAPRSSPRCERAAAIRWRRAWSHASSSSLLLGRSTGDCRGGGLGRFGLTRGEGEGLRPCRRRAACCCIARACRRTRRRLPDRRADRMELSSARRVGARARRHAAARRSRRSSAARTLVVQALDPASPAASRSAHA